MALRSPPPLNPRRSRLSSPSPTNYAVSPSRRHDERILMGPSQGIDAAFSSFASPSSSHRSCITIPKSSHIRVVARIRPLSSGERKKGCKVSVLPEMDLSFGSDDSMTKSLRQHQRLQSISGDKNIPSPKLSPADSISKSATKSHRRSFSFTDLPLSPKQQMNKNVLSSPLTPPRRKATTPNSEIGPSYSGLESHCRSLVVGEKTKKRFEYDAVFTPDSKQKEVYERTIGDAVRRNLFRGFNTTILAYGQTGSGKTYTMGTDSDDSPMEHHGTMSTKKNKKRKSMRSKTKGSASPITEYDSSESLSDESNNSKKSIRSIASMRSTTSMRSITSIRSILSMKGNSSDPPLTTLKESDGIIPRAVHDLFRARLWHTGEVTVALTYMEIYNEEIRDLLSDSESATNLELRDNGVQHGVSVKGLTSIQVDSPAQVLELMKVASGRRVVGSTAMNAFSSRSHSVCVLRVTIAPPPLSSSTKRSMKLHISSEVISAKLTLVDLAGSERLKRTKGVDTQQIESICINRDLFVLGKVISALAEKNNAKKGHIPYRDSKLTRILRDSLGGNCCTVMVACISPADINMEESVNTLRYASRARSITNAVTRNVVQKPLTMAESGAMRRENSMLRAQLADAMEQLHRIENEKKLIKAREQQVGLSNKLVSAQSYHDSTNEINNLEIGIERPSDLVKLEINCHELVVLSKKAELAVPLEKTSADPLEEFKLTKLQRCEPQLECQDDVTSPLDGDIVGSKFGLPVASNTDEIHSDVTASSRIREEALLDKLRFESSVLTEQIISLEEQKNTLSSTVDDKKAEKDSHTSEITSLREKIGDLQTDMLGVRKSLEVEACVKEAELNRLEEDVNSVKNEVLIISTEKAALIDELEEYQNLVDMASQIRVERTQRHYFETESMKLKRELTEIIEERDYLLEESADKMSACEIKLRREEDRHRQSQIEIVNLQDEVENISEERTAILKRLQLQHRENDDNYSFGSKTDNSDDGTLLSMSEEEAEGRDDKFQPNEDISVVDDEGTEMDNNSIRMHAEKVLLMAKKVISKRENGQRVSCPATLPKHILAKTRTMQNGNNIEDANASVAGSDKENCRSAKRTKDVSLGDNGACTCSSSLFSGNTAHCDFFLPKLGMACHCGKMSENRLVDHPTSLSNFLRPWQVEFFGTMGIYTAEEIITRRRGNSRELAQAMMHWRNEQNMKPVKLKACFVALHIWTRTAKLSLRSMTPVEQIASGLTPAQLDVYLSDSYSVSTLGSSSNSENEEDVMEI